MYVRCAYTSVITRASARKHGSVEIARSGLSILWLWAGEAFMRPSRQPWMLDPSRTHFSHILNRGDETWRCRSSSFRVVIFMAISWWDLDEALKAAMDVRSITHTPQLHIEQRWGHMALSKYFARGCLFHDFKLVRPWWSLEAAMDVTCVAHTAQSHIEHRWGNISVSKQLLRGCLFYDFNEVDL